MKKKIIKRTIINHYPSYYGVVQNSASVNQVVVKLECGHTKTFSESTCPKVRTECDICNQLEIDERRLYCYECGKEIYGLSSYVEEHPNENFCESCAIGYLDYDDYDD